MILSGKSGSVFGKARNVGWAPRRVVLHCSFLACCSYFIAVLPVTSKARADTNIDAGDRRCPCAMGERPDTWDKVRVARWMAHSLDWGILSTVSSRSIGGSEDAAVPVPFGNVYSFVDGPCDNATGIPYLYGTYMDQSFRDVKSNPWASFTLSEASLDSVCQSTGDEHGSLQVRDACSVSSGGSATLSRYGDPESPLCARLTLTGKLVEVSKSSNEYDWALQALYERHRQMQRWPVDHNWVIVKLELHDVWFIDYFGGASIFQVDEYLSASPIPREQTGMHSL